MIPTMQISLAVIKAFEVSGDTPSAATLDEYERTFALFGDEWQKPKEAGADQAYCESLYFMGALQQKVTQLCRDGVPSGCTIHYRHNPGFGRES